MLRDIPFNWMKGYLFLFKKGRFNMNEIVEKDVINIEEMIYEIDGK